LAHWAKNLACNLPLPKLTLPKRKAENSSNLATGDHSPANEGYSIDHWAAFMSKQDIK